MRSQNIIQNLLSSRQSKAKEPIRLSRTVSSTTNGVWQWLHRLFAPRVEDLASGLAQQVLTRAQQSFLGALNPQTPAAVAENIIDVATLNSKYA